MFCCRVNVFYLFGKILAEECIPVSIKGAVRMLLVIDNFNSNLNPFPRKVFKCVCCLCMTGVFNYDTETENPTPTA